MDNETTVGGMRAARAGRDAGLLRALARAIGWAIAVAIGIGLVVGGAGAQTLDREMKAQWQSRYRALRMQEARLEKTVELATKEYADANRRNYRRGDVRHFHRTNADAAEAELAKVRKQIDAIHDEARAEGVPLSWLYEVEDEKIDMDRVEGLGDYADDGRFGGKGAYAVDSEDDGETDRDASEDDGRNPLYTRDEAPPAGVDSSKGESFRYEEWLEDRDAYERSRTKGSDREPGSD